MWLINYTSEYVRMLNVGTQSGDVTGINIPKHTCL